MPSSPEKTYVRREHRFCLSELQHLDVAVSRSDEVSSPEFPAELVDCSRKGMKLKVPISLRFEETINVRLKHDDFDVWYSGVASVRHIRADGDNSWVIGCAIAPEVRDEIISKLASSSGKERRTHARFDVEGAGTIQRQGDTTKGLVTLRNVSEGGFCVDEEDRHESGDVVKLEIEDKNLRLYTIGACVRWQSESENGYITGYSFSNADGFDNLMACVTRKVDNRSRETKDKVSRYVLLAALVAMIIPPALSIVVQSNVSATQSEKAPIVITEPESLNQIPLVAATEPKLKIPQQANGHAVEPKKPLLVTKPVVERLPEPQITKPVVDNQVSTTEPSTAVSEPTLTPESSVALSPMREWVDNSGQYRITAELQEIGDNFIKIQKPDGTVKTVPMDRLSNEDLRYLINIKAN